MKGSFDDMTGTDPLDRVLGFSPLAEPDAWFTARTLARCRTSRPESRVSSFSLGRIWARCAVVGLFVLCAGGLGYQQAHRIDTLHMHHQHRVQEAFEVMATMGKDKDSTDSSWPDSSL
jgi:hypothetical protein